MSNPEQAMLQVHVSFPSGCGKTLALPQDSTVGELKVLVPKSFRQGFLKLVTEKGHALTNPEDSLLTAGIQEGAHLTVVAQQPKVAATAGAFAIWCCGDHGIVTWGSPEFGGNSSAVQDQLKHVRQVQATGGAFAAILANGSVVTWGDQSYGGDSSAVQDQLKDVQRVQGTHGFLEVHLPQSWQTGPSLLEAIKHWGGNSSVVQHQLKNVQQIQATGVAFAAILADGSVVTWGDPDFGGNSSSIQLQRLL